MKKILFITVAIILASTTQAATFHMHLYKPIQNGGSGFFENYEYMTYCVIEIEDTAIAPGVTVDINSTNFKRLECEIAGGDRSYLFSYGFDILYPDFWNGSHYSNRDFGLKFDAAGKPLRFDSMQIAGESSATNGFYDSPEIGSFGFSDHSYWGPIIDDNYETPAVALLSPTYIGSTLEPRGYITSSAHLPAGADAMILNGRYDFYEQMLRDADGSTIENRATHKGYYSFDEPEVQSKEGEIGDFVWHDVDADGWQDSSERGLADVTVNLRIGCDENNIISTVTNSEGSYLFSSLPVGTYQLEFIAPAGYEFTIPYATGTHGNDSNPDPSTGLDNCRPLVEGQTRKGLDAGFIDSASASEAITLENIVYNSTQASLWIRASSDLVPEGSSIITATAVSNGVETVLGAVGWKANKGYYQQVFNNVSCAPDEVILVSDTGAKILVPVTASGNGCDAIDKVEVLQAIYFTSLRKLWIKAQSDSSPTGSANLIAIEEKGGAESVLGSLDWKANKNAYQQTFNNISQAPDSVVVESDLGGSARLPVAIRN